MSHQTMQGNDRNSSKGATLLLLMILVTLLSITNAYSECNQHNFSPCDCSYGLNYDTYDINCNNVLMADVATVFQTKPALNIRYLSLHIRPEGDSIPADLLGQSRFFAPTPGYGCFLMIDSYSASSKPLLTVDPNAFRASKNVDGGLYQFELNYIDASRLDFQFLSDMGKNLTKFDFRGLVNFGRSLPTLPFLPALKSFYFDSLININEVFSSPDAVLNCNGILDITISMYFSSTDWNSPANPKMNDESMSRMMDWLLPSSANSLEIIRFLSNVDDAANLSRTPLQLASFKNLKEIYFPTNFGNMTVLSGAFFSNQIERIGLYGVVSVENGAFQGNYSMTRSVYLGPGRNSSIGLNRFDASAFKPLLEQMVNSRPIIGSLNLGYNTFTGISHPFDCYTDPCHLAWITRDNRYLLTRLTGSFCYGSGETFEEMSPYHFSECPSVCSS